MMNFLRFRDFTFVKKCNNAEYASVATGFIARTTAVGLETLNVPEELFTLYQTRKAVLSNLVAMSRIADETGKINDVETKIYNLLKYMLSVVKNSTTLPITAKKEAGTSLYNATRPYLRLAKAPQRQKAELLGGLIFDLSSDKLAAHIQTLGMESEVEQLTLLHAQFSVLLDSRSHSQMLNSEETSRMVRKDMDELFEMLIAAIWVQSFTKPSEEINSFIKSINKLLSDTETAYNQRRAQSGKKDEEKDESTDVEDVPTDTEVPSEEQGTTNE